MNRTQVAVLGLAVAAFGGAYFAFNSISPPPVAPQVAAQPVPTMPVEHVLVAAAEIPMGSPLNSVVWKDWPKSAVSEQMIIQPKSGPMDDEYKGALARVQILKDEPIRRDRIVKAGNGGLMSAILPAGKRAVMIGMDGNQGQNGQPFIAANDKVDIVKVARDDDATKAKGVEVVSSQTIVENALVLGVTNNSATLELDPEQAQIVMQSQREAGSQLRLSLRSLLDSSGDSKTVVKPQHAASGGVTVVRFGATNP